MLFKNIIGHDELKSKLINAINDNRVSHAQLFLGPEGSGKLAVAIAYARYILCSNKQNDDACGTCRSCQKINKLEHPDLHFFYPIAANDKIKKRPLGKLFVSEWRKLVLEKKSYISLQDWYAAIKIENKQGIINADDCNEVIRIINMKSYESEFKIIIIYMVEKLYHASAPKLLKAFEEPPEKTVFLLVAENQDLILKTILSRVQLVKIPKHKEQDVAYFLQKYYGVESQDAAIVSKIADGNLIEASRLYENAEDNQFCLEQFKTWMRLCYKKDREAMASLIQWIDEMGNKSVGREKLKRFFIFALRTSRNCLLFNSGTTELLKITTEEYDFVSKFHPFINQRNIEDISNTFNKALFYTERNINPKILFMDLSFKMMRLLRM